MSLCAYMPFDKIFWSDFYLTVDWHLPQLICVGAVNEGVCPHKAY